MPNNAGGHTDEIRKLADRYDIPNVTTCYYPSSSNGAEDAKKLSDTHNK